MEVEPALAKAFCARACECDPDKDQPASSSPLPKIIVRGPAAEVSQHLSFRARISRSLAKEIPLWDGYFTRTINPEMLGLVEIDGDNNEVPPVDMLPNRTRSPSPWLDAP